MRNRRTSMGGAAAVALLALGCGAAADEQGGSDVGVEFAATSSYVTTAVDDSARQPHRFAVTVDATPSGGSTHAVFDATGSFDGERMQVQVDFESSAPEGQPPGGVSRDDLYIETITEADTLYARAPIFGTITDEVPGTPAAVV
jgi:hypothetical protein